MQPWFFGPCWTVLYTCMGVASYLVWKAGVPLTATAFKLYAAQLVFNLAWQPLFFAINNMTLAQIDNLGERPDLQSIRLDYLFTTPGNHKGCII